MRVNGGGINIAPIKDSDYKYTKDKERIASNKRIFPYASYFLQLAQNIPYESYSYSGPLTVFIDLDAEENENEPKKEHRYARKTVNVSAGFKLKNGKYVRPYYYFGGCVYEIMDMLFKRDKLPGIPPLHKYTDPTGDIDLLCAFPNIVSVSPRQDIDIQLADLTKIRRPDEPESSNISYNELVDDYTAWLFSQVVSGFESIPPRVLDQIFAETVPFSFKEDNEAQNADMSHQIGNMWLVRTRSSNMLKIQCIIKYEDIVEPIHFMEFVFILNEIVADTSPNDLKISTKLMGNFFLNTDQTLKRILEASMEYDSYPIQKFYSLYYDNIDAIEGKRKDLFSEDARHKYFNHIQRLKYLNDIIPTILSIKNTNNRKFNVVSNQIIRKPDFIKLCTAVLGYYDNQEICKYDYNIVNDTMSWNSKTPLENISFRCNKTVAIPIVREMVGNLISDKMVKHVFGSYPPASVKELVDKLNDIIKTIDGGRRRKIKNITRKRHNKVHNKIHRKYKGTHKHFRY